MADHPRQPRLVHVLALAGLFIAFACLLKIPTLAFPHDEADELVYRSVAENLLGRGTYTLRGSPVLDQLSPGIYDHPLFHHPPLYPTLLLPFLAADAVPGAILVSWLGHGLCILAIALIAWTLLPSAGRELSAQSALVWLALLGVATDPLLIHVTRKLWIDGLMTGLISITLALVYLATRDGARREWLLIAAGLTMGLAGMAKLPALLAAPIAAYLILGSGRSPRARWFDLLRFGLPALLVVLPWLVVFWSTYGMLLPNWLEPDDWNLSHYPFIAAAVGRPWYYYVAKLTLTQPIWLVAGALYVVSPGSTRGALRRAPLLWFLLFLAVPTFQGVTGYGFQMRYLAPLAPSLYAMLLCHPRLAGETPSRFPIPLLLLVVVYGALTGVPYLLTHRYDELFSLFELAGLIRF